MSKENKSIVGRWFQEFWGNPWNPRVIDELGATDMVMHYPMHGTEPRKGREDVRKFITEFRDAFPDLEFHGVGNLIAEGDYVVGRWEGGGTHTGPAFTDLAVGSLPANSGRRMHFTGVSVIRVANGRIAEELGEEGALSALQQLGIVARG